MVLGWEWGSVPSGAFYLADTHNRKNSLRPICCVHGEWQGRMREVGGNNEASETCKPCIALYYRTVHLSQMWSMSHLHGDRNAHANGGVTTPVQGEKEGKRHE